MFLKKRSGDEYDSFMSEIQDARQEGLFITDTHTHLHFPELLDNIHDHVSYAETLGVTRFITVGINADDSKRAVKLAEDFDNVYASVGVHPHDAGGFHLDEMDMISQYLGHEKVIALGEIGLDYFRNHSPSEKQKDVFAIFLDMAKSESVPVIIHNREATSDLVDIADGVIGNDGIAGIIHCFNGDKQLMRWALDKGFFISFAGNLTYNKTRELRDSLHYIPADRLLLETDCPYLSPMPFRGKKNVPAHVVYTAYTFCSIKKIDYKSLLVQMENNFNKLFDISYARHINN